MDHPLIRAASGSLARAVEGVHSLLRLLVEKWNSPTEFPFIHAVEIQQDWTGQNASDVELEVSRVLSDLWQKELDRSGFSLDCDLSFPRIWKRLLPASVPKPDIKYYFMRSIRRRFGLTPSALTARRLHDITRAMTPLAERHNDTPLSYDAFVQTARGASPDSEPVCGYLDLCWILERLRPAGRGQVTLESETANAEQLMGHLFGVPTGIPGFDELFPGGLMLADSTTQPSPSNDLANTLLRHAGAPDQGIGGRVVLVIGPFGSGKSLLSLQMSVEVARKGGVAWVMALEQTAEECEYSMESIGITTRHPSMRTYHGLSALSALTLPVPGQGALVFLRPEQKEPNFSGFLSEVQKQLSWMSGYPLRLLVIDPVNALGRGDDPSIRSQTRAMFETAKNLNVNVWFTSEQPPEHAMQDRFEENVADTVIHVGTDDRFSPPRRYIEITKSRFQHEYSGRHAFSIDPETGLHVYPPASLVSRSVRGTGPRTPPAPSLPFGVDGMDQVLGQPLAQGDIVVLAGPGKGKSLLGVQFVKAGLADKQARNIVVSDYDLKRIDRFVEYAARGEHSNLTGCSIQGSIPDPSRVLLQIRRAFDQCHEDLCSPGRVLVTNVSRWEKEMPMLAEDVSFGIALGSLLRNFGGVSLVVLGDELETSRSPLQQTIASQADTLMEFQRREYKGRMSTVFAIIKSRYMHHLRESFELLISGNELQIAPAPLFRADASGRISSVRVALYLHAETPNHQRYNEKILAALRTTLSPRTYIASQSLRYDPQLLPMTQYSAVDELQVFQLDEYQLPRAGGINEIRVLQTFDLASHGKVLEGRLPGMQQRITCDHNKSLFAVPFYQNISFLAFHPGLYEHECPGVPAPENWDDMVRRCREWEDRNPMTDEQTAAADAVWQAKDLPPRPERPRSSRAYPAGFRPEVFFSCPVYEESVETYNCFFMELLYALEQPGFDEQCDLATWLRPGISRNSLKAALQFRSLCRRSHLVGFYTDYRPRAIYWRHWYNTLNQELSAMPPAQRSQIEVRTLFGDVTTAGDWYLAIPAHSASPEIGLDLINNLTSSEREMQRLQLGVGLPTRESFYRKPAGGGDPPVSPYFRFSRPQLRKLVESAFRRSRFHCYERFAGTISGHLRSILEIPDSDHVQGQVETVLNSLVSNIDFLRESIHCGGCNADRAPKLIDPLNLRPN
jgi:KaiC/GvpD/RAD55 family RecA-like ATPase